MSKVAKRRHVTAWDASPRYSGAYKPVSRKATACVSQSLSPITREGTAGVPTAFIAEYGSSEPKLGILLEYEALPGLDNEAVFSVGRLMRLSQLGNFVSGSCAFLRGVFQNLLYVDVDLSQERRRNRIAVTLIGEKWHPLLDTQRFQDRLGYPKWKAIERPDENDSVIAVTLGPQSLADRWNGFAVDCR